MKKITLIKINRKGLNNFKTDYPKKLKEYFDHNRIENIKILLKDGKLKLIEECY